MGKGRPTKSIIRDRIVEILFFVKETHGYNIHKFYNKLFTPVSQRVIYYHLNKGLKLGIFKISKIVKEKGNYSWGNQAEKVYYTLGPNAKPTGDLNIKNSLC